MIQRISVTIVSNYSIQLKRLSAHLFAVSMYVNLMNHRALCINCLDLLWCNIFALRKHNKQKGASVKQQPRQRLRNWSGAASNFITLISYRLIRQMLAIFSRVEFEKTLSKFRKRERKSLSCVHVLQKTCSRTEMYKKGVMHVQRCLILLYFCRPRSPVVVAVFVA